MLAEHPAVLDAAVSGLPDDTWEVVAAAVRLREPLVDPAAELAAWYGEGMAPFTVPARFVVVDAYPVQPSGKTQTFRLGDQLTGGISGMSAAGRGAQRPWNRAGRFSTKAARPSA